MIFSFQGNVILENPLHIVLIAVPPFYRLALFLPLPAALATTVGVLTEVPVMLFLVKSEQHERVV